MLNHIYHGSALPVLKTLPPGIVDCGVSSPPYYGLRAYGTEKQIWDEMEGCEHQFVEHIKKATSGSMLQSTLGGGRATQNITATRYPQSSDFCIKCNAWRGELGLEPTPELFIKHLVQIYSEVRRILKPTGVVWVNIGDSYSGGGGASGHTNETKNLGRKTSSYGATTGNKNIIRQDGVASGGKKYATIKPKDLIGIPWMLAFALRADGWYLRQEVIWSKANPMPESVTDRCTKSHESIFLLSKSRQYYFDNQAILEPAAYDGRKDTQFKGGVKYQDQQVYAFETPEDSFLNRSHEHWPNKLPNHKFGNRDGQLSGPHSGKNWTPTLMPDETVRGYKDKDGGNGQSDQHHGDDISSPNKLAGTNYGGDGKGFKGHSGIYGPDGELLSHSIDGVPARNKRSVWNINTYPYPDAHFATFPEELPETCIKAGSSEYGCCADCGAPWERVIDKKTKFEGGSGKAGRTAEEVGDKGKWNTTEENKNLKLGPTITTTTTGWEPTCHCNGKFKDDQYIPSIPFDKHPIKPAVVLDQFFGSGTTGSVARRLGRDFIGIELNEKYIKLAEKRLHKDLGMFA